jgi:hypothetical protein
MEYTVNVISQNFFYYSLGFGFLVLVGFLSYAAFNLSKTLKELTLILERVDDMTKDIDDLENYIKNGILYLKGMFSKKGQWPIKPMPRREVK